MKYYLQGIIFPSPKVLLVAIHEIVRAMPRPTLEDVFRHWMERLELDSQNNGEYYPHS
jgi:hypothetical protein